MSNAALPELFVMIGLPRSGKSTWARGHGAPVVSGDSIRRTLHGQPFIRETEPWVHTIARTMVEALFIAGHKQVILDECNMTQKQRDEWVSDRWNTRFVHVPTNRYECQRRAKLTGQHYLLPVIERMAASAQWPDVGPGDIEVE